MWEMSKSKLSILEEEELTYKTENKVLFPAENGEGSVDTKKQRTDTELYDTSMPAAWQAMQRSLAIATPYLPLSTRGNVTKRYELLRPHLSPNFLLLPEILSGNYDLKMMDPDLQLCVWVDTVEERNSHHGIYTVELKDETGATIRAWMEPNFVKQELEKAQKANAEKGVVRVGVVWMLSNLSMIAIPANGNGQVERMLVVSGKRILQVWTPESDHGQPTEEEDSPESQRKFLDWMEKRNALTVVDKSPAKNNHGPPEEEQDDGMEEIIHNDSNPARQKESRLQKSKQEQMDEDGHIVGGKEQQIRMTELSALTLTADDENVSGTKHKISSNYNRNTFAKNERNKSRLSPTPPLPDRNVNQINSIKTSVTFDGNHNDENHQTSELQTQESVLEIDENYNNKDSFSPPRRQGQGTVEQDDRISTQSSLSKRNSDCNSSRILSVQQEPSQTPNNETCKRNKSERKMNHCSSTLSNKSIEKSPKRSKRASCNSPIRMSQLVWNTPDPSILEMLQDSDCNVDEEEEIPTVMGEEAALSMITTQATNTIQTSNDETSQPNKYQDPTAEYIEKVSEEPLVLMGRALLAGNLFDPSNWKGVDATAFSESDSE